MKTAAVGGGFNVLVRELKGLALDVELLVELRDALETARQSNADALTGNHRYNATFDVEPDAS